MSDRATSVADLDKIASEYFFSTEHAHRVERAAHRASLPLIRQVLGERKRVLELGFGQGARAGELAASGYELELVEGSGLLVEQARRVLEPSGVAVHHSLFENFRPSRPFDAVLALHILEHVDDPVALLTIAKDWLQPGGVVIGVVPNAESLHRQMAVRMGLQRELAELSERDRLVGHQRVYTLAGLEADFVRAGYVVERTFGYFVKTLTNKMMEQLPEEVLVALTDVSDLLPDRFLANIGVRARLS